MISVGSEVQVLPGPPLLRGRSSVGRAVALQAIGRRFDPVRLHQLALKLFFDIVNINIKYIENFNFDFFYICV